MDSDTASQFVSCLVRCIQTFCHGYVHFSSSIEIVGHIYLNVDKGSRFNYIVNEEVSKTPGNHSTVYHTNSYHSLPPARDMLLKMSTHQDRGVELISDNQRVKNTESSFDTTSSTLPNIRKKVSLPHPVSMVRSERGSVNILEVYSRKLPCEEYKNRKSPPLSSASAGLLKRRTHSKSPQKPETSCSTLDASIVIKQEPEIPFYQETKYSTEEDSLMADEPCRDDNRTGHPHPVSTETTLESTGLELLACNGASLPADSGDSVSCETASSQHTKSLTEQIRQKIVAYANIVGNRPAARHFGVHESSIRHWRKKFAMILQGSGGQRGRKRKGDRLQDMRDEVIQASSLNVDHSD